MYRTENGSCMLQAHRGVSTDCPENTMAAFRAAVEQGYEVIELDPAVTLDGEFVILHDKTVNRTGRENGKQLSEPRYIANMTLEEALRMDFGSWFSPRFSGERIPTLKEVLDLAAQSDIMLKFDNKMQSWNANDLDRFFSAVESHKAASKVGFTCSDMGYLETVAKRFPHSLIHYDGYADREHLEKVRTITKGTPVVTWIRYDNAHTAWCKNPAADNELCSMVKEYGRLGIWLLSDYGEASAAVDIYGADIIETTGAIKPC